MKVQLILIALALAGCRDHREQPAAPTADEANQLNEMDAALNGLAADNEEEPADRSTGSSNASGGGPSRE